MSTPITDEVVLAVQQAFDQDLKEFVKQIFIESVFDMDSYDPDVLPEDQQDEIEFRGIAIDSQFYEVNEDRRHVVKRQVLFLTKEFEDVNGDIKQLNEKVVHIGTDASTRFVIDRVLPVQGIITILDLISGTSGLER